MGTTYTTLLYYNKSRWFSQGKVLFRTFELCNGINEARIKSFEEISALKKEFNFWKRKIAENNFE